MLGACVESTRARVTAPKSASTNPAPAFGLLHRSLERFGGPHAGWGRLSAGVGPSLCGVASALDPRQRPKERVNERRADETLRRAGLLPASSERQSSQPRR